ERGGWGGGGGVGVVAHRDGEGAAAVALREVDREETPAVTTLDEALAPEAPLLHETLRPAGHFRDLANLRPIAGTNICHHFHHARGDIEQGFAEADVIFEDVFTFPMVHHYSMEPHVAIAQVGNDQMTVWASTQHPFPVRKELAEMFGLPLARVQVIVPYIGGAYGNKSYTKIEPLVVALARKVGCPVRLALTGGESFKTLRRGAARGRRETGGQGGGNHLGRQCAAPVHRALPDRGLCRCGTARGAESRLHGRRAVSHSALAHRHLCSLFQHRQQCRVSWLRRATARLGLRIADGHHGRASGTRPP